MRDETKTAIKNLPLDDTRDFVREFLLGETKLHKNKTSIQCQLPMDARLEGWMGLPHGGIGMGTIMELATLFDDYPAEAALRYPITADFRLGGAGVRIGDTVDVVASSTKNGIEATISAGKDLLPYLSAIIEYGKDDPAKEEILKSYLPKDSSSIEQMTLLPFYRNCFVCGVERYHPGLQRKFHLWKTDFPGKIVISRVGWDDQDKNSFYRFQRDGKIHPVALMSLLDETSGWGAFMLTGYGMVTVFISFTIYRDITVNERLVCFGRGEKKRGKTDSRMLAWSSGGAAVINSAGHLEPVMTVSSQFFAITELTEQMRTELIPAKLTMEAFRLADS